MWDSFWEVLTMNEVIAFRQHVDGELLARKDEIVILGRRLLHALGTRLVKIGLGGEISKEMRGARLRPPLTEIDLVYTRKSGLIGRSRTQSPITIYHFDMNLEADLVLDAIGALPIFLLEFELTCERGLPPDPTTEAGLRKAVDGMNAILGTGELAGKEVGKDWKSIKSAVDHFCPETT
jgi:hypothetical protein